MRILIVAATKFEIDPLLEAARLASPGDAAGSPFFRSASSDVDILISGVGQLQCAYHLGTALTKARYDLAINLGIGGSFRQELSKCSVAYIVQEELADLGAEDREDRLDLFQMGLLQADQAPFTNGVLRAPTLRLTSVESLPRARAVTVNRVLGSASSIEQVVRRYDPDIVSMEGGAFFYACLCAGVPFVSIRSVSDFVAPRDKSAWDIPGAIRALCEVALPLLGEVRAGGKKVLG